MLVAMIPRSKCHLMAFASVSVRYYANLSASSEACASHTPLTVCRCHRHPGMLPTLAQMVRLPHRTFGTQTSASTSLTASLLTVGHGHGVPAKPTTPSQADNILAPMGGCARRPPSTLVRIHPAAASSHSSASHSGMSADSTGILYYLLHVRQPLVVDAADGIKCP